jgi:hypothetical protein
VTGPATALTALLCTVFAASAYGKVRSTTAWQSFISSLRPLGFVPARLIRPVSIALLAAEGALAIALFWSVLGGLAKFPGVLAVARWAAVGAVTLLLILTGGVVVAVVRHTKASCACFGVSTRPLGRLHVVRNCTLLIVAVLALLTTYGQAASAGALLVGAVAGVVGALLIIRLDDLADLFFPAPA